MKPNGQAMKAKLVTLVTIVILTGCDTSSDGTDSVLGVVSPVMQGSWYKPMPATTWQWQLSGTVNTDYDVDLYDIDLFDSSVSLIQQIQESGKKVICYFSAGSFESWRDDSERFNTADLGNRVDGWENERWLDIRSAEVHEAIKLRLDLAQLKGCDGVEPDNMDAYQNDSGFSLTLNDQLAYNRLIANEAHLRELSVGLKNNLDQFALLVGYFDFAVVEQCYEYDECDALTVFTDSNKAVLNAEYMEKLDESSAALDVLCADSLNRQFSTLVLPLNLDDSYRFSCLQALE